MFTLTFDSFQRVESWGFFWGIKMNLVDTEVKHVLSEPYQMDEPYWYVDVIYNYHGKDFETRVMTSTKESAEKIEAGYIFKLQT